MVSVFLVLVLLLRIVPLVDSIENFEALRDTILSAPLPIHDRRFLTIKWWRVCRRESMRPGYVGKLQKIDASLREPLGGYAHVDFGLCRRARDVGAAAFGAFRLMAASSCAGSSRRLLSCCSRASHLPRRTSVA